MLSPTEITELEKKVSRYRLKKYSRYGMLCSIFISAIGIFFSVYWIKQTNVVFFHNDTAVVTPTMSTAIEKTMPVISAEFNESASKNIPGEPLLLKTPNILAEKVLPKKELPLPSEEDAFTKISTSNNTIQHTNKEDNIDTSVLAPPPLLEETKQKGIIKIESQEINSIQYLKEKFEKTHNIIFALMLSEEYYLSKDYPQSNKWALIANQLDSENEKSWIWFAKSKVKLGQKDDAVVALKAYLKNNKSKAAQTLLNQILLGEINE